MLFYTIMRQSRDKLCEKALRNHFNQYSVEYNLELLSPQPSDNTKKLYKITIPECFEIKKPKFISTLSTLNITNDLNMEWNTEVMQQNWPKIDDIKDNFKKSFILYEKKKKGDKDSCAYTRIQDISYTTSELTIVVIVSYFYYHYPFPKNTDMKKIIEINNTLLEELDMYKHTLNDFHRETDLAMNHYNYRVKRLRKQLTYAKILEKELKSKHKFIIDEMKIQQKEQDQKYQEILQKYYKESNNNQECPVCYEVINSEELYTPSCSHLICQKCSEQCKNKCPICRIKYNIYDIKSYNDNDNLEMNNGFIQDYDTVQEGNTNTVYVYNQSISNEIFPTNSSRAIGLEYLNPS